MELDCFRLGLLAALLQSFHRSRGIKGMVVNNIGGAVFRGWGVGGPELPGGQKTTNCWSPWHQGPVHNPPPPTPAGRTPSSPSPPSRSSMTFGRPCSSQASCMGLPVPLHGAPAVAPVHMHATLHPLGQKCPGKWQRVRTGALHVHTECQGLAPRLWISLIGKQPKPGIMHVAYPHTPHACMQRFTHWAKRAPESCSPWAWARITASPDWHPGAATATPVAPLLALA